MKVALLVRYESPSDDMQVIKIFEREEDANRVLDAVNAKNENNYISYEVHVHEVIPPVL